jgi:cell division protein FtsW (lipid II flippase)
MSTVANPASASSQPTGFRRFWRALRQLFHEVVGAIFAVLALAWLNVALRSWTRDVAYWLIAAAIVVALVFLFFSASSFRRARRL